MDKIMWFLILMSYSLSSFGGDDHFHEPVEINDGISFWENVYENYSRSHYIIHDDRHLNLIYEVIVSDTIDVTTQKAMKKLVASRKLELQKKLKNIAHFPDNKLTVEEKIIKQYMISVVGEEVIKFAFTRVRLQRGIKEKFHDGVVESEKHIAEFKEIFREAGLPEDLAYLPHVESSFSNVRSHAGAAGYWQFTKGAARIYGLKRLGTKSDERMMPLRAAQAASLYLKDSHEILGNWPMALMSYHSGLGGMIRAKRIYGDDLGGLLLNHQTKIFKFASRNYYSQYVAAVRVAKRYEKDVDRSQKL